MNEIEYNEQNEIECYNQIFQRKYVKVDENKVEVWV